MTTVLIVEKKTRTVVARPEINLGGSNYTPDQKEWFDEAWRCAVEDGAVDPDRRAEYEFRVV